MSQTHPYRWAARCCYLGMFVQALVINLTPLLFIPLKVEFDLTFEQIGRLILINFTTQMVVDLLCIGLADRVPLRPMIAAGNGLAALGLGIFAWGTMHFPDPYLGMVAGTVVFSIGCGLLEVLLSPMINAIPSEDKSASMAFLHAFYPVGKVAVIVVTGLALWKLGPDTWAGIMVAWAILPMINFAAFLRVKLPPLSPPGQRHRLREILSTRGLYLLLVAMLLAGATEVTIAQWTSAYAESALGFPKVIADLVGFTLFGLGMIAGRMWFGFRGEQGNLRRVMVVSAGLSSLSCVAMALLPSPLWALLSAGLSGLFVSMLWPGTISMAAARFPLAGASLFAVLAAAGDSGAALMPWLAGLVADQSGVVAAASGLFGPASDPATAGLKAAFLLTALWPLLLIPVTLIISLPRPPGPGPASKAPPP